MAKLMIGTLAVWAVIAYPARRFGGEQALLDTLTAMLLCLAPASLTLAWADRALRGKPEEQLLFMLGGTGIRMIFVLGAGLLLYYSVEPFQHPGFWLWVLLFYLMTLAGELVLMLSGRAAGSGR